MGIHPDFVFHTRSQEIVEVVKSSFDRHARWQERVCDYAEYVTGNREYSSGMSLGREVVLGFLLDADEPMPEGWRRSSGDERCIVPDQRYRAGKEAAEELNALPTTYDGVDPPLYGMPDSVRVNRRNRYPEVALLHDVTGFVVEATWFTQLSMRDPLPVPVVPDERWEQVPLFDWLSNTANLERILNGRLHHDKTL